MECAFDINGGGVHEPGASLKRLSTAGFERLSLFIHQELGIKMPPAKKPLLESRLQKRLRALGYASFTEYCEFLFSPGGLEQELVMMIDLVTTNKTDFFREPHHFDFLSRVALPALVRQSGPRVTVWSAGCSTGEEPYTIAAVMSDFGMNNPGIAFDYSILATDISTRVLEHARKGIYKKERLLPVPDGVKRRYFLRSRDASKELARVCPELREKVRFMRLNFMDEAFPIEGQLDIIFCRNVIIYFNKETQERLIRKFCERLRPGGYLFLGHSETLSGLGLPLKKVSASVYTRQ